MYSDCCTGVSQQIDYYTSGDSYNNIFINSVNLPTSDPNFVITNLITCFTCPTPTPTQTPTQTPTPTITSTNTQTPTPTPTVTETPTNTPTPTNTVTPTNTITPTPTQPLCNLTLSYDISTSVVCTMIADDVDVCMNNCDLCVATVIYETDGLGDCTSTLAADGYYSDGTYKRNFVSGVFTGPCELCNPTPKPTNTPTQTPTP